MHARRSLTMALVAVAASSSLAHADYVITSSLDAVADDGECTLREAVRAIATGQPVNECPAGAPYDTIVLTTDIVLGDATSDDDADADIDLGVALQIVAEGPVTLSPAAGSRVFDVAPGADVGLQGLACDGLDRGTCLRVTGATVTGSDLVFEHGLGPSDYSFFNGSNSESVVSSYDSSLVLERVTFSDNTSKTGGAVIVSGGQITIVRGSFTNNEGWFGGAMSVKATTATLVHTLFDGNRSDMSGGAIYGEWSGGGTLTVTGSSFIRNTSGGGGGAILTAVATTVSQSTFTGNAGEIGALSVFGGGLRLRSSLFVDNTSSDSSRDVMVANTYEVSGEANLFGALPQHFRPDVGDWAPRTDLGPTGDPGVVRYLPSPFHQAGAFAEAAVEGPHIDAGRCDDFDGNLIVEDIAGGPRTRCDIGARDATIVYPRSGPRVATERVTTPCAGLAIETWWNDDRDPFTRSGAEAGARAVLCDGDNFAFASEPVAWDCMGDAPAVGADLDDDGRVEQEVLHGLGETRAALAFCAATAAAPPIIEAIVEGPSAACVTGGQRLRGGVDLDGDEELDPAEITFDELYCNRAALAVLYAEDDTGRLVALGVGRDVDLSGAVDPWELSGVVGLPDIGRDPVMLAIAPTPAGACVDSGWRLTFGRDLDESGAIDGGEPVQVVDVCDEGSATPGIAIELAGDCATYGERVTIVNGLSQVAVSLCATGPALAATRVSVPCDGLRISAWHEVDGAPGRSPGELGSDTLVCDPPTYTLGFERAGASDSECSAELRIGPRDSSGDTVGLEPRTAALYSDGERHGLRLCAPPPGGDGEGVASPLVQAHVTGTACRDGGRRLVLGHDRDEDMAVDDPSSEVVVCDTRAITVASRIQLDHLAPGPRAYAATQEVTAYEDFDGDGVQQPSNATSRASRELHPGDHALAIATRAASCAGGVVLRVGTDLDGDGQLSEGLEGPVSEAELCPVPLDVRPPFIALTEPPALPGCSFGSFAVDLGWDLDEDGVGDALEPKVSIAGCRSTAAALVTPTSTPCVGHTLTIVADTDGDGAHDANEAATTATLCSPSYPVNIDSLAPELAWQHMGCDSFACYIATQMQGAGFAVTTQATEASPASLPFIRTYGDIFYAYDTGMVPGAAWVASGLLDVRSIPRGDTCGAGGQSLALGHYDGALAGVMPRVERIVCQRPGLFARTSTLADGIRVALGRDTAADGVLEELELSAVVPFAETEGAVLGVVSYPDAATCAEGGVEITLGHDLDRDGALGANEPGTSARLCDETGVKTPLVQVVPAAMDACLGGGSRLELGLDDDGDGTLDASEVRASAALCRGPLVSLVDLQPAGAQCESDGLIFVRGLDVDRDGRLSADEITETVALCDASTEAVLIEARPLGAATGCEDGGTRLVIGSDLDGDGVLDDFEITDEAEVCTLADLPLPLVVLTPIAAGATCPAGGARLTTGVDLDGDGVLEADEVTSSASVCNGPNVLVVTSAVTTPCSGQSWRSGADLDGDGILGDDEVQASATVCDGADGEDGAQGLSAAIAIEPLAGNDPCPAGGVRVSFGLDDDGDGVLDRPGEVDASTVLCNGLPGPEGPAGPAGQDGEDGIDGEDGQDGTNGEDGKTTLVTTADAGDACPDGGLVIRAGVDIDDDGTLDPDEVTTTETICAAANGADGEDGASCTIVGSTLTCPDGSTFELGSSGASEGGCTTGGSAPLAALFIILLALACRRSRRASGAARACPLASGGREGGRHELERS